jgi:hypothetical protein
MTQEKINTIFQSSLGQQLTEIFVTPDDGCFIRLREAQNHCRDVLKQGDDASKYEITIWYNENEF